MADIAPHTFDEYVDEHRVAEADLLAGFTAYLEEQYWAVGYAGPRGGA